MSDKKRNIYLLLIIVLAVSPLFLNSYCVDLLNNVGLYAILALSLNIILGYAGLFHMGHAAFYAVGAYFTAIINVTYDIPILWLFPFSGLVAGLFAVIVARPIIHLRGDYLLIVTIGVVQIVGIALTNNIFGITGGADGIVGISRPVFFGYVLKKPFDFFYFIWIFAAITIVLFSRLENSRFGRALKYLKEDEVAAEGNGINTTHYKFVAFILGAVWAGMAGNIFACKMTMISPGSFNFWESVILFTIVILGGSGSIRGVILGAFLIIGLPEVFRDFASARMLIFGGAMVVMMIFRSEGIIPLVPGKYKIPETIKENSNTISEEGGKV